MLVGKVVNKDEFQKLFNKSEVNQLKALFIKRNKAKGLLLIDLHFDGGTDYTEDEMKQLTYRQQFF